jgi:hypothetical protein
MRWNALEYCKARQEDGILPGSHLQPAEIEAFLQDMYDNETAGTEEISLEIWGIVSL